jgi:hypothetical protein
MNSSATQHQPRTQHSTPHLHLVPPVPHHPHHSPLALWHLLSLDAPTVATLWTIFIAHCSHITLPWAAPTAMFLAVWMIYAADRLLDARLLDTETVPPPPPASRPVESRLSNLRISESRISHLDLEARHRFHHQHRTRFLTALVLSAVALTTLLHHLDPQALHLYALLATLLAAWMLLIHISPAPTLQNPSRPRTTRRLPKELAVGLFFPAAIFIPTLAHTTPTPNALHALGWASNWLRPTLLPAAILFACICTLNCLYLYAWEHPTQSLTPTPNTAPSTAHSTTRWATAHLTHLAIATLTLSTITAATCLQRHALTTGLPALACALSAAALVALNHLRHRIPPIPLRATADLVLLTPLLLLPFTK